ncbi:hypothetical protein SAMD00019534_076330 [Acytostelium subglobosum LB1]|uniref:hypothetical protein n=1 Tax=Acytostelium subglobosum LB1 TaxID=1410327 RepID=UPI000644E21B|nr:hypothetical protein SAMD00019534_076330 [Acytostelium subglobosum LB1]GAM24458.1 hypothetical protein SAMD00019534_076330 [Acytostelium subglobosum LB1]|eukprot:XP_012752784.1 hypothetical protein SAMD00019534_076330 [Acytostelium subglobosum LB1]
MDTARVVFLRSPPYTGKTAIGQLVETQLIKEKPQAYTRRLSFIWSTTLTTNNRAEDFTNLWTTHTNCSFNDWLLIAIKKPVYLIIDECHVVYPKEHPYHSLFWPFIKSLAGNIHVLLLSVYGEKGQGSEASTPVELAATNHTPLDHTFLQFSFQEYLDLVRRFGQRPRTCPLPRTIASRIWNDTRGHVGLVKRFLVIFEEDNEISKMMQLVRTEKKELSALETMLFNYLVSQRCVDDISRSRAAPTRAEFTKEDDTLELEQLELLDSIITSRSPEGQQSQTIASRLIKRGFLVKVLLPTKRELGEDPTERLYTLDFPSPLYKRIYLIWRYTQKGLNKFLITPKDDITKLIVESIRNFRPEKLASYYSRRAPLVKNDPVIRPLEVVWHDEFYYASTAAQGPTFISPNVGKRFGCEGEVDFYINSIFRWAIELLSEGDRQEEHVKRFETTLIRKMETRTGAFDMNEVGIYCVLLGMIDQWIVVDFTAASSEEPNVWHDHLCVVTYSADFKEYKVYTKGKDAQIIKLA